MSLFPSLAFTSTFFFEFWRCKEGCLTFTHGASSIQGTGVSLLSRERFLYI